MQVFLTASARFKIKYVTLLYNFYAIIICFYKVNYVRQKNEVTKLKKDCINKSSHPDQYCEDQLITRKSA